MSHFTVTVRLPAITQLNQIEAEVKRVLAPYNESNEAEFVFEDETAEARADYETGTSERVVMPDGRLLYAWDDEFKVPGTFGWSSDGSTHKPPAHLERREVPFKELFSTFEAFATEYKSLEVEEVTAVATPDRPLELGAPPEKRYGTRRNPRGYWDWYQIGGRWRGILPVRDGAQVLRTTERKYGFSDRDWEPKCTSQTADACRIRDLDRLAIEVDTDKRVIEFHDQWRRLLDGEEFPAFEGPREMLFRLSLMSSHLTVAGIAAWRARGGEPAEDSEYLRGPDQLLELAERGWTITPWKDGDRADAVAPLVPLTEFRDRFRLHFDNSGTFAFVDAIGWRQPGKMLMFGCSTGGTDDYVAFEQEFRAWRDGGDQDDWLVVVDCHT